MERVFSFSMHTYIGMTNQAERLSLTIRLTQQYDNFSTANSAMLSTTTARPIFDHPKILRTSI